MDFQRLGRRGGGSLVLVSLVMWLVTPAATTETGQPMLREEATVTIAGRPGSFGIDRDFVPSGQGLGLVEAAHWSFPAGRKPGRSVFAPDGTLLMAAASYNDWLDVPTSQETSIGTYHPASNTSGTVRVSDAPGTVTDLVVLPDAGVAYTAWIPGTGAVFGLLTKANGKWQALAGNTWSGDRVRLKRPLRIVRLPDSGDLVVAQEGQLTALRVSGPDGSGRGSVTVTGSLPLANDVTPWHLSTNSLSRRPTEQFVAGLAKTNSPWAVQEFTYNAGDGQIAPLSAAMVSGDVSDRTGNAYDYRIGLYDRHGNLWVARGDGGGSGPLALYTAARCPAARTQWAHKCPPQYNLFQARELGRPVGLTEDPATGTVVLLTGEGTLMPLRISWDKARKPIVEAGNVVDPGRRLLTIGENTHMETMLGPVDGAQRLWMPTVQLRRNEPHAPIIDHWLVSVALNDLFKPAPVPLESLPGRSVTIQAENTSTTRTFWHGGNNFPVAYVRVCDAFACSTDDTIGRGFYLSHWSGFGFGGDGSLDYVVNVPEAGKYRLSYHVGTFPTTTSAAITMNIAGRIYTTPVATKGEWRPMTATREVWLDAGVQTISITPPPDGGGWFLNSMTLRRI